MKSLTGHYLSNLESSDVSLQPSADQQSCDPWPFWWPVTYRVLWPGIVWLRALCFSLPSALGSLSVFVPLTYMRLLNNTFLYMCYSLVLVVLPVCVVFLPTLWNRQALAFPHWITLLSTKYWCLLPIEIFYLHAACKDHAKLLALQKFSRGCPCERVILTTPDSLPTGHYGRGCWVYKHQRKWLIGYSIGL